MHRFLVFLTFSAAAALQPTRARAAPEAPTAGSRRAALATLPVVGLLTAVTIAPTAGTANDFGCSSSSDDYFCKDGLLRAQNGLPAWEPGEETKRKDETCGQLRCGFLSKRAKPAPAPAPPSESPPEEK